MPRAKQCRLAGPHAAGPSGGTINGARRHDCLARCKQVAAHDACHERILARGERGHDRAPWVRAHDTAAAALLLASPPAQLPLLLLLLLWRRLRLLLLWLRRLRLCLPLR